VYQDNSVDIGKWQMNYVLRKFILYFILCSQLLISVQAVADEGIKQNNNYDNSSPDVLEKYAKLTEAVSGGFKNGSRVFIRVGDQTFFENIPQRPSTAGLYVVAIHNNSVLLKRHYNTYQMSWASDNMAEDIRDIPQGTFVVVAAKGEPTRYFDKRGQQALYQIGASTGLLNQKFRTSYLCIGVKGIAQGRAIEQVGMKLLKYRGAEAGKHIALKIGPDKESKTTEKKVMDPNGKYEAEFAQYVSCSEVVSSGPNQGNHLLIRIGNHTFYENVLNCPAKAGLYVVAIYKDQVLLQRHYNTHLAQGASLGLDMDISKLPNETFVVIAANNEPARFFDKAGQKMLHSIGAETGLLKIQGPSYLCLGTKGMEKGKAIEKLGIGELKYMGSKVGKSIVFTFPKKDEPEIKTAPGKHEGLIIGDTEAIYYIPKYFDPNTAKYLFCIHGAGAWHRNGALTHISNFQRIADIENLVVIAPVFTHIFNWPVKHEKDLINGKWKDLRIIKDLHLHHMSLLNGRTDQRADSKLIEIFEYFNWKLMKREKFHLYGHSGGAQFVSRFIVFHPELIDKVALSSAGSFLFPRRDIDFPYGIRMEDIEKNFGPHIKANDLKLSPAEVDEKLNRMLDLRLFILVGENETEQSNRPERNWQGKSTLEKTQNFYKTMRDEDLRLKEKGVRPKSKPYQFELHIMPDVAHNAFPSADKTIELLFPTKKKVKDKILYIDFGKGILDRSGNGNKIKSKSKPKFYHGSAVFDSRKKQYLHIPLNKASDLIGCTEMTIHVSLRIEPQPNKKRGSWIIHTDGYHRFGTALVLDKDNKVNAWIQTTSSKRRPAGKDIQPITGKSPTLTSQKRIDDGQWHDIRLVYTGEKVMLFIDNVIQEKLEWKGALINASQINIGYLEQHRSYFNGEISKIEVLGHGILH